MLGEEYIRFFGEEIPVQSAGFEDVVDMLSCLFAENPFEGLSLSLFAAVSDGIFINIRPRDKEVQEEATKARPSSTDEL